MIDKYIKRAEEILPYYVNMDRDEVIAAMCQLAEEVEKETTTKLAEVTSDLLMCENLYTKQQVEELLQKQRELSLENERLCRVIKDLREAPDYSREKKFGFG